jgi:alkyl hydroperoxide reductase subunit AhpC
MLELGQLERRHEDFARRQARVIAVSVEGTEDAKATQSDFPHLLVIADKERGLSDAVRLIHPHSAPDGGDTAAPTTIIVDRRGVVRWFYRPAKAISRLSADDVLRAIDEQVLVGLEGGRSGTRR